MNIERKKYAELLKWKASSDKSKAILIKGARRVGKSYLAETFAKKEYKTHIIIDFSSPRPGTLKIFREYGNKELLNEFFNQLSVLYGVTLYPGKSLFVFDEVQKYPQARELIKHLVADGRYDYIETGSLISIKKNVKNIIIPSEEQEMELLPLDFEEFLNALSDETTIPFLQDRYDKRKPLGNLLKPVMDKLRTYMIVGGMPKSVVEYAETGNIGRVEETKQNIIKLYREDIAKYAENYVSEATAIFQNIPSQLAHHDKKIKFSSLHENGRFSSYRNALFWIEESMVGNICYGMDSPAEFGDFALQSNKLKCYMGDTGLLITLASEKHYYKSEMYKSFMLGKLAVNQGMITENLIAQMLRAKGYALRFYEKRIVEDDKVHKYELDFLISNDKKIIPIEVKSGYSNHHPSIDYFRKKYGQKTEKGILLTKGDLRETDDYLVLPLPMALFL